MPNSNSKSTDTEVAVNNDTTQVTALGSGCPSGNIYNGAVEQPTRQGLRTISELQNE